MNWEVEENVDKAEFNFIGDFKKIVDRSSLNPNSLQLEKCFRNNQEERAPLNSILFWKNWKFWLHIHKLQYYLIPRAGKKQLKDAVHFTPTGSTNILVEISIFLW